MFFFYYWYKLQKTSTIILLISFRYSDRDDTVGTVVEQPTAALRVAGSIPARNKYLYGLQVVVSRLPVCVCDFSIFVNTGTIPSVGRRFLNLRKKRERENHIKSSNLNYSKSSLIIHESIGY